MNPVIKKAISLFGSQGKFARKAGVSQAAVSNWLNGGGIHSDFISKIVSATDGLVTTDEILHSFAERKKSERKKTPRSGGGA